MHHSSTLPSNMAQQISLILVLAFCALARADIELTGQPMNCSDTTPPAGKTDELLDFSQFLIDNGGKGFAGSITFKEEISSLQVSVFYVELENGDTVSTFRQDQGNVCSTMGSMMNMMMEDSGPESNFLARIMEDNPESTMCMPPLEAKTYNMDGVLVNQSQLKGLVTDNKYEIQLSFETTKAFSCIKLNGKVVPDT